MQNKTIYQSKMIWRLQLVGCGWTDVDFVDHCLFIHHEWGWGEGGEGLGRLRGRVGGFFCLFFSPQTMPSALRWKNAKAGYQDRKRRKKEGEEERKKQGWMLFGTRLWF